MENEEKRGSKADDAPQPPAASLIPETEAPTGETTGDKSRHKANPTKDRLDRDLVRWTRMLAFFTGALVFAAGLQFWAIWGQLDEMKATREGGDKAMADQLAVMRKQAEAMRGQVDLMAADQRPWLRVASVKPIALHIPEDSSVVIILDLEVTNIGRQPAEQTDLAFDVYPTLSSTEQYSATVAACQKGATKRVNDRSELVFPGETRRADEYAFPITNAAIKASWDAQTQTGSLGMKSPFSSFYIAGCITYRYEQGVALGQTGFVLQIDRRCLESPVGKCGFVIAPQTSYGGEDMIVSEERSGLFAK